MGFMRMAAACAAIGLLAAVSFGCGDDDDGEATGAGNAAEQESAPAEKYTIGIVGFSSASATSNQAIDGIKDVAAKNGWETTVIDAQGAPSKAISALQTLVQKKVDVIVVTVFPPASMSAGAMAAQAAGIPIVNMGGGTGTGVQSAWGFGTEQGKLIAAKLKEESGGEGALLALGYKPGLPCQEREKELMTMLDTASFELERQEVPIPGQVEASTKFTQAWLAKHPEGSGKATIWACFDEAAMGAITALKQAGRKDIEVFGIDGVPQGLRAVRSGDLTATVWVDAFGAGQEVGEAIPEIVENGVDGEGRERPAPSVLVDANNIEQFLEEHPDALTAG